MGDTDDSFRAIFKGGSVVFLGRVFELGVSFVGAAIVARLLGQTGYGTLALGSTLLSVLVTISLLGINTGIGRYLPRSEEPSFTRSIILSGLGITVPIALIVAVVIFLLADPVATVAFTDPSVAPVLRAFAFAIPATVVTRIALGSARGLQESLPKVYIQNVTFPVSRLSFAIVAILVGAGELGVAWAYTLARVLTGALALYYLLKYTPLLNRGTSYRFHRELLTFSAPFTVSTIMSKVLKDFDTFLVGYFSTTGAVGSYNVAYQLALLVSLFSMGFGYMLMPVLSQHHANEEWDAMNRIYEVGTKWIAFASLPIFFATSFLAPTTIRLTFGADFVDGAPALAVLSIGFLFSILAGPAANALMTIGYSKRIMYDNVLVTALNVVLNVVLIPRYGILGAGVATTLSYVVLNVIYAVQLYRDTGFHPFTSSLLKPLIAAFGSMIGVYVMVSRTFGISLLSAVLAEAVFVVTLVVFVLRLGGIEREEIMILDSIEDYFGINLTQAKTLAKRLM